MRARRIAFAWIVRHWAKTLPSRGLSFRPPKSDRPIQKSISCIALGQRIGLTHYVVEIRQKPLANIKGRSGASPQQLAASVTPFLARVQQRIHTMPMRCRHWKIRKILDSMIAVIGG